LCYNGHDPLKRRAHVNKVNVFLVTGFILLISQVSAYSSSDIEWESVENCNSPLGESVKVDDYVFTADDFNKGGYAYITIYKDNKNMTPAP
jgi:hypothetical protein